MYFFLRKVEMKYFMGGECISNVNFDIWRRLDILFALYAYGLKVEHWKNILHKNNFRLENI